jgi:predicted nuclease of predicted toxin-antitoxin system
MKILLDECLPRRLLRDLRDHQATTVHRQGWSGLKDKELLQKATREFDIFITLDSNLAFQQNLRSLHLCIIVIRAINSRYETLQPLASDLQLAIENAVPNHLILIGE